MILREKLCQNVLTGSKLDLTGNTLNVAWVIDGADAPQANELDFNSAKWLVKSFSDCLIESIGTDISSILASAVEKLRSISGIAESISKLPKAQQPCFTLGILIENEENIEIGVIGDAFISVLNSEGQLDFLTDIRIHSFSEKTKMKKNNREKKLQMIRNRDNMNINQGYWVATADKKWLPEVITMKYPKKNIKRILICSDGFCRIVNFGLVSWQYIVEEKISLKDSFKMLRHYERNETNLEVKQYDDVSAMLFAFN